MVLELLGLLLLGVFEKAAALEQMGPSAAFDCVLSCLERRSFGSSARAISAFRRKQDIAQSFSPFAPAKVSILSMDM